MYILLCGKQATGKDAVSVALRDYYSYRGTACYTYDFMEPIHEAHDAVFIALHRHGMPKPPDGKYSKVAMQSIYDWLHLMLPTFMGRSVKPIVQRWVDLKMFHITVIHGMTKKEHVTGFPTAYKVLLECDLDERVKRVGREPPDVFCLRDHSHPIETGFCDCAARDIFDLVVDTTKNTPDKVASLIGESLHTKLFGENTLSNTNLTTADGSYGLL